MSEHIEVVNNDSSNEIVRDKKRKRIGFNKVKVVVDETTAGIDKKNPNHKPGRNSICLFCRQEGHLAKFCRLNKSKENKLNICFNCGSSDHILRNCTKAKSDSLSFATCFICSNIGHLSKDCPENPNGLFPNGGCCHICQLKTHFSRECPSRKNLRNDVSKKVVDPIKIVDVDKFGDDELIDDQVFENDNDDKVISNKRKKFTVKNKYYSKPTNRNK